MRTPTSAVRGVFVVLIILGVVSISNIGILNPGAQELLLEEPTPSPTPTAEPELAYYFPVIKNNYGFLYSSVVVAQGQGFDNCKPLTTEGMQTWWDHSPYSVVNIYLGGISALCPFDELDIDWYTQVAEQGWSFILTWAGPQSPHGCPEDCKFRYPMSTNPAIAYVEGKLEALAAVETAEKMGFEGQLVIYYDVESYSGADDDTRAAVADFIRGWTEQLHELDHIAGAYGAACTSYVVDWAFIDPSPDDVWLAHWNKVYEYDPDATVYNTPCLDGQGQPPIFWTNHQRLKQYTGPHNETWGDLTLKIDSDVLDGQVVALFGQPPVKNFQPSSAVQSAPQLKISTGKSLRDLQLLSPARGWVLRENQLLWTNDGGTTWRDISPDQVEILGVHFNTLDLGWAAARRFLPDGTASLSVFSTFDAGKTWSETSLSQFSTGEAWELESAAFDSVDQQTGWLALKLHSGNNFSFGRLLATEDGGASWQERELPLGEPVVFADAQNGWTAGGPLEQVYHTNDGGLSWSLLREQSPQDIQALAGADQPVEIARLPGRMVILDSFNDQFGWAVTHEGTCRGYKPPAGESIPAGETPLQCESAYHLVRTMDAGLNWIEVGLPE